MPSRDATGPFGEGKMTGRGLGLCNFDNETELKETNSQPPLGLGIRKMRSVSFGGRGRGRGSNRRRNLR